MSFQDKVVIVTGGSSGIGAATAIKFVEEGAKVTIVGRNKQKLDNVARLCGNPLVVVADVTKDEDVKRIVDETLNRFGKLDILINNAGMVKSSKIQDAHAMATFDQVMSTNLRSVVYLTHLAAPHIVEAKGNIVNVSSIAALQTLADDAFSYCTSKASLDHFSRSIAQELAPLGVRVNIVNPGPVRTDIIQNSMGLTKEQQDAAWDMAHVMTALQRISDPEEVADLILFLASDKAKAITGSTFVTDNGARLKFDVNLEKLK